jgi:hypothetical protein
MPFKDRLKAIVGALGALVAAGIAAWADRALDSTEITALVAAVMALATAVGVYHAKNQPSEG